MEAVLIISLYKVEQLCSISSSKDLVFLAKQCRVGSMGRGGPLGCAGGTSAGAVSEGMRKAGQGGAAP